MRTTAFIVALSFFSAAYAQTDSLERINLDKAQASRKISKIDRNFILKKWEEFIQDNDYPEVFLNDSKKIEYSYYIDFEGQTREKLYNRINEWLAIRYGIMPSYSYGDAVNGKIIYSGFEKVSSNRHITFSCVFTIKDDKILVDFENIAYEVSSGGYYSGDDFIPENTVSVAINDLFPIITKPMGSWRYYFAALRKMDSRFKNDMAGLNEFINSYDQKYSF